MRTIPNPHEMGDVKVVAGHSLGEGNVKDRSSEGSVANQFYGLRHEA